MWFSQSQYRKKKRYSNKKKSTREQQNERETQKIKEINVESTNKRSLLKCNGLKVTINVHDLSIVPTVSEFS